jgi:proton glutamate symport protein
LKLSLTAQCVAGVLLGAVAGIAAIRLQPGGLSAWLIVGDSGVRLWTNALQLVVLPLVVAQLFVAISARRGESGEATRLGVLIPATFIGLFALTATLAILLATSVLRLPAFAALSLGPVAPVAVAGAAAGAAGSGSFLTTLIPPNLFAAASANAILPLMLFTLVFALAARRIPDELHQALELGFEAIRDAMYVIVGWVMRLAPVMLFALAFRSTARSGLGLGGALLGFIVMWAVTILACIALQYLVAVLSGGASLRDFARAVFPAQATAIATRSSMATVPVLLREAELTLRVPTRISALVIPTGAALLKLSQAVSPPLRLLFLASVLRIQIEPAQVVIFTATILLLSPSIAGVPRMVAGTNSLPAYVAAGIPAEYVILLGPLNAVLDFLITALNATGYMTANVVIARLVAGRTAPSAVSAGSTG